MNKAWLLWMLTALFFFFEYCVRVAPSILFPFLEKEMNVGLESIGVLSVMFYYPYILMQMPVGMIVDRCNIKKVMVTVITVFGLSTVLFSLSHNIYYAYIARAIMGLVGAFAFVGSIKIITLYFDGSKSALLVGATQGLGMLGAVVGFAPMYYFFSHYGWHYCFLSLAMIFFIIAILILFNKAQHSPVCHHQTTWWQDIKEVISSKLVLINAFNAGLFTLSLIAFGEQWGTAFLASTNLDNVQATHMISIFFIGVTLGCPALGLLSDIIKLRGALIRLSSMVCCVMLVIIIYQDLLGLKLSYLSNLMIIFIYGFFQGALQLFYALSTELVPLRFTGFCAGFTNMSSVMIGAFFIQSISHILDHLIYKNVLISDVSTHSFQLVFFILPLSFLIVFFSSYLIPETHGKRMV